MVSGLPGTGPPGSQGQALLLPGFSSVSSPCLLRSPQQHGHTFDGLRAPKRKHSDVLRLGPGLTWYPLHHPLCTWASPGPAVPALTPLSTRFTLSHQHPLLAPPPPSAQSSPTHPAPLATTPIPAMSSSWLWPSACNLFSVRPQLDQVPACSEPSRAQVEAVVSTDPAGLSPVEGLDCTLSRFLVF